MQAVDAERTLKRTVLTWVAVLLIVLWLVGYIGFGEVVGSFIHTALVLAFVAILARLITGRRATHNRF